MIISFDHYHCLLILLSSSLCVIFTVSRVSSDTMKAAVITEYGKHDKLFISMVPMPSIKDDQILVKVKAAAVNPVDTYTRSGYYPIEMDFPIILGKELSGTVEKLGSSVTKFKVGDRVFCAVDYGAYAEYAAANVTHCFPLPEKLTYAQGSSIFTSYFTAYRGIVLKGGLKKDSALLVHGTNGNVGVPAIHIAKCIGAYVVATVGTMAYEDISRKAGADYIVNHNIGNYMTAAVNSIPKDGDEYNGGFDVILEIIRTSSIKNDKQYLNPNGLIIVLGSQASIAVKNQYLRPGKKAADSVSLFKYTVNEMNAAAEFVLKAMENGTISPVVEQLYPLEDASVAHADITRTMAKGKLVLEIEK